MNLKDNALLVSLTVSKPQLTTKDDKATADAERANNASGAGQYRKDLYPKSLVAPILSIESSARAFIDRSTYPWNRGEHLLATERFFPVIERMDTYKLEFDQAVTAFLNNWANVMRQAQDQQGALFNANAYPDVMALRKQFDMRLNFRPVTDAGDFRVQLQDDEMERVKLAAEQQLMESVNDLMRAPLERLRETIQHLYDVTGKPTRTVSTRKGDVEVRPPIFRDSVIENIIEEVAMLHDFAALMPDTHLALAKDVADALPHPQALRDDPAKRDETRASMAALLQRVSNMLGD
jgi:hypothetical protein